MGGISKPESSEINPIKSWSSANQILLNQNPACYYPLRQVRVVSLLGSCYDGDDDMKAWHFSRVLSRVPEGESVGERTENQI